MEELTKVDYGISAIEKIGTYLANSGLFGMKTPAQAIALCLIAQAEGMPPALAARDYDVIQGRPALKAKAKLARFQAAGGIVKWLQYNEQVCEAIFSHPSSPNPVTIRWSIEDAKRAELAGKEMYRKFPRQMLSSRVISEGVDRTFPAAGGLLYVPEEVMDFEPVVVEPQKALPEPPKVVLDPFIEMIDAEHLDDRAKEQLVEYVTRKVEQTGKDVDTIKKAAVKRQKDFWTGFLKFQQEYDIPQTFPEPSVQEQL
jgi:hypothetical protein